MARLWERYVCEESVADIMKYVLGVAGFRFGLYGTVGFELAGLLSLIPLPQVDQFYHTYIWPAAKFAIGSLLLGGPAQVLASSMANILAINTMNTLETVWVNNVVENPLYTDVTFDFSMFLDYVPGFGSL